MSVIDSGEASSGDDSGTSLSRKESKGTIQFLDHLGHGLVTSEQQKVISGKPGRIDPRNEGAIKREFFFSHQARGASFHNVLRDTKPCFITRGGMITHMLLSDVVEHQQPYPQLET